MTIKRIIKKYIPPVGQNVWDEWYEIAKEYYRKHGNLNIPGRYETNDGKKLGRWIERQRAAWKSKGNYYIDQYRILRLNRIGMIWQIEKRATWDQWIQLFKKYKRMHGNVLIPKKYCIDGYALGEWVAVQRQKYKKKELSLSHIDELEEMGMVWCLGIRNPWSVWYEMAKKYYKEHGNLLIPYGYLTEDRKKLGIWINIQRDRYFNSQKRYKTGKGRKPLTKTEIILLEEIGMVWKIRKKRKFKMKP